MKKRDEEKLCALCESAAELAGRDEFLCSKYGVVSGFHKCRRFVYDPMKRRPPSGAKRIAVPDGLREKTD